LAEAVGSADRELEASLGPIRFGGLLDDRDRDAVFDIALVRALARRLTDEHLQRARAA
jgi:hypothetical protein